MDEVEALVTHDLSLSVRVLRSVNSAAFGIRHEVTSLRHALVLLGLAQVRKWASVWAMAGLGEGEAAGIVTMSLVRARCCEFLSEVMPGREGGGYFLLGLCSLLDVILRRPMPIAIDDLPLPALVREALLGGDNPARTVLDTIVHYERGEWDAAYAGADRAERQPRSPSRYLCRRDPLGARPRRLCGGGVTMSEMSNLAVGSDSRQSCHGGAAADSRSARDRSSRTNCSIGTTWTPPSCTDRGDSVGARTLNDAVLSVGLDALTCGLPAFINLTHQLLLDGAGTLLPRDIAVLEIREDIPVDDEVVQICRQAARRRLRAGAGRLRRRIGARSPRPMGALHQDRRARHSAR